MSKLLEAMKEALGVMLFFVAFATFFAVLLTGISMLANGDSLVGLLILIPVVYVGLTVTIFVNK